ncbi:hypothetical protein [Roseivivax sp. CAU 1761]
MRSQFKTTGQFTVQRKRGKSIQEGFQSFDQNSVFDTTEPTQAHLLAHVVRGGDEPVVRIRSDAFGNSSGEHVVKFRSEEAAKKTKVDENVYSSFAIKPARHGEVPKLGDQLNPGDLIELQAVLVDPLGTDTLYPWTFRAIAPFEKTPSLLPLPEVLCTVLHSTSKKDETKKDYRIAIASPAEAEEITDVLADLARLKKFLGYKMGPCNGFIIRGPHASGKKKLHGAACYRTLQDDENRLTDEAVILNLLKMKSQVFAPYMSADNPWEIIPLHIVNVSTSEGHRMVSLAKRYSYMAQQDGAPQGPEFGHANVVLDYSRNYERPICTHFNVCRQKPIRIETGLPTRARPKKIKTTEEAMQSKATALFS